MAKYSDKKRKTSIYRGWCEIPSKESIKKYRCTRSTQCIYGCSDYEFNASYGATCNYLLVTGRMRPPKVNGVCQEFIKITKDRPRRATEAQLDFFDKEFRAGHEARRSNMQRLQDR